MSRHKEFDREDVLEKAMQVFWSQGYECTSVQDLVDAMGINRGSIYATFGDKHGLSVMPTKQMGLLSVGTSSVMLSTDPCA